MAVFSIRGISLDIPGERLNRRLEHILREGRYEGSEADALARHLVGGDRFLDLGAGAGFLCCLAAARLGAAAVAGVEPDPVMVRVARQNLARNGFPDAPIVEAAVVPDGHCGSVARLRRGAAYWSSRLVAGAGAAAGLAVPAITLGVLMARLRPTVLACDIEGGELGLFDGGLPGELRLIVLELHPVRYGAAGTRRVFDALSASGFAYCPEGSRGATVVMTRV